MPMIEELYKHKGNGKIYVLVTWVNFTDFSVKQSSNNVWENVIAYVDRETMQPFITGESRFKERFEKVEINE